MKSAQKGAESKKGRWIKVYLTYNEYVTMGGTLEQSDFTGYEYEAENVIDWYTFNRLRKNTEYPEAVKRCVFLLIRLAQQKAAIVGASTGAAATTGSAAITSQSNDGVSISYNVVSAGAIFDSYKQDVYTIIKQSLAYTTNALGQKLLYMGVYPDE